MDSTQSTRAVALDPECDVAEHFPEEVLLLRAAMGGLEKALGCDAYREEALEAWKWCERVEASAWALRRRLERQVLDAFGSYIT